MRIGNILASIGIVLGLIGLICLPLWNLHELPFVADSSYPKGGGWIKIVQTGIFARPGFMLIGAGGILILIAKLLPKKYWQTADDLLVDQINKGYKNKKNK